MGVRRPYCPCRDTTQRCVYDVLEVFKKARSQGRDVHSFAVEVSDAVLRRLSQSKQFSIVDVGIRVMVAINAATGRFYARASASDLCCLDLDIKMLLL